MDDFSSKSVPKFVQNKMNSFSKYELFDNNASLMNYKLIKPQLHNFSDLLGRPEHLQPTSNLFLNTTYTDKSDVHDTFPDYFLTLNSNELSTNFPYSQEQIIENSPRRNIHITGQEKTDIVKKVELFLENFDKHKIKVSNEDYDEQKLFNSNEISKDVKNVIMKLFPLNTNSPELTNKLIKIYERQRSAVSGNEEIPVNSSNIININSVFEKKLCFEDQESNFKLDNNMPKLNDASLSSPCNEFTHSFSQDHENEEYVFLNSVSSYAPSYSCTIKI